ncbi:hypothetical protein GGI04_004457, partial [Coemansia thaxteri]
LKKHPLLRLLTTITRTCQRPREQRITGSTIARSSWWQVRTRKRLQSPKLSAARRSSGLERCALSWACPLGTLSWTATTTSVAGMRSTPLCRARICKVLNQQS